MSRYTLTVRFCGLHREPRCHFAANPVRLTKFPVDLAFADTGHMTEALCDIEIERRELMRALEICLSSADRIGHDMVGIFICSAIDCLGAEMAQDFYSRDPNVTTG